MNFGWLSMPHLWYYEYWIFDESWYKWSFAFDAKMYAHDVIWFSLVHYSFSFSIRCKILALVPFEFWLSSVSIFYFGLSMLSYFLRKSFLLFIQKFYLALIHSTISFHVSCPFCSRRIWIFYPSMLFPFNSNYTHFHIFYHVLSFKILKVSLKCIMYHILLYKD